MEEGLQGKKRHRTPCISIISVALCATILLTLREDGVALHELEVLLQVDFPAGAHNHPGTAVLVAVAGAGGDRVPEAVDLSLGDGQQRRLRVRVGRHQGQQRREEEEEPHAWVEWQSHGQYSMQ